MPENIPGQVPLYHMELEKNDPMNWKSCGKRLAPAAHAAMSHL
jgi:hypothetical protein